jgi:hypothetical protein
MSHPNVSPNIQKLINGLGRIGDINLSNTLNANGNKVDVESLMKSLANTILRLDEIAFKESDNVKNIENFLDSVTKAVVAFCAFLDNDDNEKKQYDKKDPDDDLVVYDNLAAMEKDFESIVTSFKTNGNVDVSVLAVLSNIVIYFSGTRFTIDKADYDSFKSACDDAYMAYKSIKIVGRTQNFNRNTMDIMSFIITLCIITIPTISLAKQKVDLIIDSKKEGIFVEPSIVMLTGPMVAQSVQNMYGSKLEYILASITDVVGVFVKKTSQKNKGSIFSNCFKIGCFSTSKK